MNTEHTNQSTAPKPFGYFKAEARGWVCLAKEEDGAIALYDRPQAEPVARDWPKIDAAMRDYVAGYEMIGDNNEVCYSPTKAEQELIIDCVRGLLAESDFINLLTAQPPAVAVPELRQVRRAQDGMPSANYAEGFDHGWNDCIYEVRAMLAAAPQAAPFSAALTDIAAERRRQIEAEGWTPEHDDKYGMYTLAGAAGCYAMYTLAYPAGDPPRGWPWDASWWKPSDDPRRNWVKAGALIAAEIERLDRAEQKGGA